MANITLKLYEIYTSSNGTGVTTLALANRQAKVTCKAPSDTQQTIIRLWRRGGSVTASHALVGEFPISTLVLAAGNYTIVDNVADASLGAFIELDNDVPVSSVAKTALPLPFIWGPFDQRVLGCGDPNRPEAVYFSKQGNADSFPPQNFVIVSSPSQPLINGCVYNNRSFVFTNERQWELVQGLIAGVTFSPFPTPCSRGLISPYAVVSADYIYFVAKDGIYRNTGGPEESLVENDIKPIFPTLDAPGRSVNGLEAIDLSQTNFTRLFYHNGELWFTYKGMTTASIFWLIYDVRRNRWRQADYTPDITCILSEPNTASSLLLGDTSGNVYTAGGTSDAGTAITATVRTGAHDQGVPLNEKEYGSVIFDIDPGGATNVNPVVITPYINGEATAQAAINVTGTGRQRVALNLSDMIAYNIEYDITWARTASINPVLYGYDTLYRLEPASLNHFEVRETSHGLDGWQHIRDCYVTLRSSATVTLTLTFDGNVTQTYTIASTGGARKKIFVPMNANKFKLVRYQFDSANPFKLYITDSEVHVRSWVAKTGYSTARPFGAEDIMAIPNAASAIVGSQ
jgi:hypothetical protein